MWRLVPIVGLEYLARGESFIIFVLTGLLGLGLLSTARRTLSCSFDSHCS